MNDTNSFLETSVTAMFLTAIVRGVRGGLLDRDEYDPVIKKAWSVRADACAAHALHTRCTHAAHTIFLSAHFAF